MKAILIRQPGGLQNTRIEEVEIPKAQVVVKVAYAGLNPIDINVIGGRVNYNISPYPHIPGAEFVGVVDSVSSTERFRVGDRILVYPKVFDGTCDRCVEGKEQICRNGGVVGAVSNGGFSELYGSKDAQLVPVPDSMSFEDAVSIPVGGLTAYHALKRAGLRSGDRLLVVGASGNTGWYAMALGRLMGATVFYSSRKKLEWQTDASTWKNEKVDVIVNSIGSDAWEPYMDYLDTNGRLVTFGTLTGKDARLNLAHLYTGERSVIGSTGGSRDELNELVKFVSEKQMKSRLWKIYDFNDYERAITDYADRQGRIILRVSEG